MGPMGGLKLSAGLFGLVLDLAWLCILRCFGRLLIRGDSESALLKKAVPVGPKVVPFRGSYIESYKVILKRNYYGAYGW